MSKQYQAEFPIQKTQKRLNCVLDLDNSIISSLSLKEIKKIKNIDKRKLDYQTMEGYELLW